MDDVVLDGDKVRLRDWHPSDLGPLRDLLDPGRPWHKTNGPYFGTPSTAAAESTARELTTTKTARPDPRTSLAVCDLSNGRLIGRVGWYWESRQTDWRRMGLAIYDERYWGGGFGTEALRMWTTYLFSRTDALRLDFATFSGNPGMIAVGRRLGFVEEGRFRRARRWSGGVHDAVVYGVLREEWDRTHQQGQGPA
ncbi:GNAT family N-acetyltransferase [Amycolatopsis sp. TNS106]|uniref:GNAT family N-acetyltransferase n=1 Tax=Amycolatopsis sp. TNS106 TaxID=2861750 RepID=UPI001C58D1BD|nr:GNAT family protein [Amycolatopsis sp. TNS106]QXV61620.1 N-acetyltransferase [Amycolatopsis sp. TNS106]